MTVTWHCLSVREPWASAIVLGHKTIENRSHGFAKKFRGRLYIHAGSGWSPRGACDPRILEAFDGCDPDSNPLLPGIGGVVPRGAPFFSSSAIIGHVEVIDIHEECGCVDSGACWPWGETEYTESGGRRRGGLTHLVLEDAVAFTPDEMWPARGRLGIWKYQPEGTV